MRRAALAVLLIAAALPARAADPAVLTAPAVRRDVAVAVRALGRLEAARSTVVGSEVRGDRGKIIALVDDGARVREGDVLVRLDPTPFEEEVARLEAREREQAGLAEAHEQVVAWEEVQAARDAEKAAFDRRAAELDLEKLERGDGPMELERLEGLARRARAELAKREGYLADLEALEGRGYANPVETAAARRGVEEAREEAAQAGRQLANYRDFALPALLGKERARLAQAALDAEQAQKAAGFRVGKALAALRQARQELAGTRAALAAARRELERTVIRAPIPGMVVLRDDLREGGRRGRPRVGDQVWQGQPLIFLPDLSRMVVRALVREIDLHKVAPGGAATATVDAYPALRLPGRVAAIGVVAEGAEEGRSAERYFQVVVALEGEEPRLRPGMTARVEIRGGEARAATAVPVQAVFREGGADVCYVRAGALFERRAVAVGLVGEEWAEIRSGVAPGEEVALSPPPPAARRR